MSPWFVLKRKTSPEKPFRCNKLFPACSAASFTYDFEIHLFTLRTTWGTYMQLKVQTLTDAPEGKTCLKSQRCKLLNQMKMSTFIFLPKYLLFFSFSTSLQKQQNTHVSSNSKSFYLQALNALCFVLHPWALELFVKAAYKSLSCPQCKKRDFKIIQSLLEKGTYGHICTYNLTYCVAKQNLA